MSDPVAAAIAVTDASTARFNARDSAAMDTTLHFPHVILNGSALTVWEKPGQLPATFFDDLMARTGWHHSIYIERRAVLVVLGKVHLYAHYTRSRADDSVISRHKNLWVITEEQGRWGIKQRSY